MQKVVRNYGVLLLGPEVPPLERVKWNEVKPCEVEFRPMAFWVWGGPGCLVHSLSVDASFAELVKEPTRATVFAPPKGFRLPVRSFWPERLPMPIESKRARGLFAVSGHSFARPERFTAPSRFVLTVEGPFQAGAVFGDWYVPSGGKSDD